MTLETEIESASHLDPSDVPAGCWCTDTAYSPTSTDAPVTFQTQARPCCVWMDLWMDLSSGSLGSR